MPICLLLIQCRRAAVSDNEWVACSGIQHHSSKQALVMSLKLVGLTMTCFPCGDLQDLSPTTKSNIVPPGDLRRLSTGSNSTAHAAFPGFWPRTQTNKLHSPAVMVGSDLRHAQLLNAESSQPQLVFTAPATATPWLQGALQALLAQCRL